MDYQIEDAIQVIGLIEMNRRLQNARAQAIIEQQQQALEDQAAKIREYEEQLGIKPETPSEERDDGPTA